jgi:hypothetical protein
LLAQGSWHGETGDEAEKEDIVEKLHLHHVDKVH